MDARPQSFFAPPRVSIGAGAVAGIGGLLRELGVGPDGVLLVTDATLAQMEPAARVQASLSTAGFIVTLFAEITGEPTEATAEAATLAARRARPAAVVGLGGGSALDTAKLAAVMATNAGAVGEYFAGKAIEAPPVPLVTIPTTAGTGAESSRNAVITRRGRKAFIGSPWLVPAAAILDPELTLTLPPRLTAWTGMDALSHCVEALLSANASALTDAVAVRGIQMIREALPQALADGGALHARAQMQVAAYLGGFALNAGMVLGHSLAYTLANRLHLAHGLTCALALAPCLAYNLAAAPERSSLVARALGSDGPAAAPAGVRRLASSAGIPLAWRDVGLAREDLPALVEECLTAYPRPNNPAPLEREALRRLCEAAWEGEDYSDLTAASTSA